MNKTLTTLIAMMASSLALAQNAAPNGAAGSNGMMAGMGMMDPAERFKQLDKNNDGKLTQDEYTNGMQQMRGQGGPQGGGQGGGAGGPPNGGQGGPQGAPQGNGQNGSTPAGANGSGMGGGMMMDPAARFKAMDKNSDGKVSKDEFTASMQQMQQMRGQQQSSAPAAKTSK